MTYAEQIQGIRKLSKTYIHLLQDADWYVPLEANGVQLNNISWIVAHLAASQTFLQNYCIGKQMLKIPWARQFGMGSAPSSREDSPSKEEILDTLDRVFENTVKNISDLDPVDYSLPNPAGFKVPLFADELSIEDMIFHGIWHESHHSGQLANWAKALGIKTL